MSNSRLLTHALRRPDRAEAAVHALSDCRDQTTLDGLVELVSLSAAARPVATAVRALASFTQPIVIDALRVALGSPHAGVRQAALEVLRPDDLPALAAEVVHIIHADDTWLVRRQAVRTLARGPAFAHDGLFHAATDPHWRVRHALVLALLAWGDDASLRPVILERLACEPGPRATGLADFLRARWSGDEPPRSPTAASPRAPFDDDDPAVLAHRLASMAGDELATHHAWLPALLGHSDERVGRVAAQGLKRWGSDADLLAALAWLDDPRTDGHAAAQTLLARLDPDHRAELAEAVLGMPAAPLAQQDWALKQLDGDELLSAANERLDDSVPLLAEIARTLARGLARATDLPVTDRLAALLHTQDEVAQHVALAGLNARAAIIDVPLLERLLASSHGLVRAEAARAACRQGAFDLVATVVHDADARVRQAIAGAGESRFNSVLQEDEHPLVRAAALSPEWAAQLMAEPTRETSWHVLARAAILCKRPFWELEPREPWSPPASVAVHVTHALPDRVGDLPRRTLGTWPTPVSRLGISGHYGLSDESFAQAYAAGINLMFWEPGYQGLTRFVSTLPAARRRQLCLIAGTFEADPQRIERDIERCLRMLGLERLPIFLLFWVQSWPRAADDVLTALDRLKQAGKLHSYGLSTHSRPLAVEAIQSGWNPVMVRHSLAHRGAETHILPAACRQGTSIITFNNTCYGRLLQPGSPVNAADCYRYSLGCAGVTVCLSAPANRAQLDENLRALTEPSFAAPPEVLQAHGARVYREDGLFVRCLRSR